MDNTCAPDAPQSNESLVGLLDGLWRRSLPILHERLDLLDRASAASTLDADLREEATCVAHKLAGSLGMFGHHEATLIARSIEQHLEADNLDPLPALTRELRQTLFPA